MNRSPRQIAKQYLDEAVRQKYVSSYVLRDRAGRATVYWGDGTKSFPSHVLDVLAHLKAHGFHE